MSVHGNKRALIIVGAGASIDFGIPATIGFGNLIEKEMQSNKYCVERGGWRAYTIVKSELEDYYSPDIGEAHFERIYHVLHELAALHLSGKAVPKFMPVLHPFLKTKLDIGLPALRGASSAMMEAIYKVASSLSGSPKLPIASLSTFLQNLNGAFIPRIYSTNYDDFFGQAYPGLFTGFTREKKNYRLFSAGDYWSGWGKPGLFHLHGSIHMGFPRGETDIGDLCWFDSRDEALKHAPFVGSGISRMDGTLIDRGAILTGLDKLGRIQQSPYSFYYAGLSREVFEADLIFILGSGLADLHLNTWIKAVRKEKPQLPLVYVGFWGSDIEFYAGINFEQNDRNISLVHDLRMKLGNLSEAKYGDPEGWVIDPKTNAAVCWRGFKCFLERPDYLSNVLNKIMETR